VWPQIFNNGNCRYWKFYCQNPVKTEIETRLLNVTFSNFVPFHREEQRNRKDFWQFADCKDSRPPPTPSTKCDVKKHVLRYLISESTCFEKWKHMFSDFPCRAQRNSAPKTQSNLLYPGLFFPHRHEVRKALSLTILFLVDIQQKCLRTHYWWHTWPLVRTHQKHENPPSISLFLVLHTAHTTWNCIFTHSEAHPGLARDRNTNLGELVSETMWCPHILIQLLSVLIILQPQIWVLLWIEKARAKEKTYKWRSVRWETKS
jgi:hypothetical protein